MASAPAVPIPPYQCLHCRRPFDHREDGDLFEDGPYIVFICHACVRALEEGGGDLRRYEEE
ncbi:MAG: hypothetical protein HYY85_12820 [Deltaproteobacteria bacterium]|nr:hypothetical protein [Deltaproteobacteria bacterium]